METEYDALIANYNQVVCTLNAARTMLQGLTPTMTAAVSAISEDLTDSWKSSRLSELGDVLSKQEAEVREGFWVAVLEKNYVSRKMSTERYQDFLKDVKLFPVQKESLTHVFEQLDNRDLLRAMCQKTLGFLEFKNPVKSGSIKYFVDAYDVVNWPLIAHLDDVVQTFLFLENELIPVESTFGDYLYNASLATLQEGFSEDVAHGLFKGRVYKNGTLRLTFTPKGCELLEKAQTTIR